MIQRQGSFSWDERGKLEQKFWEFHLARPEVYRILVGLARHWRERRGSESVCGIGALYEVARWEVGLRSLPGEEPPKLSNNHRAYYARLLMDRNPDLAGIFRLRRLGVQPTFGPRNEGLEPNEHIE